MQTNLSLQLGVRDIRSMDIEMQIPRNEQKIKCNLRGSTNVEREKHICNETAILGQQ